MEDLKVCCEKNSSKKDKLAVAGATGSLGLAAAGSACMVGCTAAAAPLGALLGSLGLGALASSLSALRLPLLVLAVAIGAFAIFRLIQRRYIYRAAAFGIILGFASAWIGVQAFQSLSCEGRSPLEAALSGMSPTGKRVVQEGIYRMWPELGRAPTVAEIQARLGFQTEKPVLDAFEELRGFGAGVFYPGTQKVRWLWPFASEDQGVKVTLGQGKPVFARCAIDALGMSTMFGEKATIQVKTPLDQKEITLQVDQSQVTSSLASVVVSHRPDDCDAMLFFASKEEFDRYQAKYPKDRVALYSLSEALERGVFSFGRVLKT